MRCARARVLIQGYPPAALSIRYIVCPTQCVHAPARAQSRLRVRQSASSEETSCLDKVVES